VHRNDHRPIDDRGLRALGLRNAALTAGLRLDWAVARAPRSLLIVAAVAAVAALVHFTGYVPAVGAAGNVPQAFALADQPRR
jgi:hypothetical protein